MISNLTRVALASIAGRINVYLRFGAPSKVESRDNHHRDAYFAPGQLFCRVWWQGNRYGTVHWRLDIARAMSPGQPLQALRGITPGVDVLLTVRGDLRVKAVMRAIDAIELAGLTATNASASYWRVLHNRLAGGGPVTVYDHDRHDAEILRCRLT